MKKTTLSLATVALVAAIGTATSALFIAQNTTTAQPNTHLSKDEPKITEDTTQAKPSTAESATATTKQDEQHSGQGDQDKLIVTTTDGVQELEVDPHATNEQIKQAAESVGNRTGNGSILYKVVSSTNQNEQPKIVSTSSTVNQNGKQFIKDGQGKLLIATTNGVQERRIDLSATNEQIRQAVESVDNKTGRDDVLIKVAQ